MTDEAKKSYMKAWYENNKDRVREYARRTRERRNARQRELYREDAERREAIKAQVREYRRNNPGKKRRVDLAANYGITPEDYAAMLAAQGGGCAICGAAEGTEKRIKYLHVDHDHETGKVRGLLCHLCNLGIGKFQDDPELLVKAAHYLSHYKETSRVAI
jgi:hypothetical protein